MRDSAIDTMLNLVRRKEDTPVTIEETGEKNGTVILPIGIQNGLGCRTTTAYMAQIVGQHYPDKWVLHIDLNISTPGGIEGFYFPDPGRIDFRMNIDTIYQIAKKGTITGNDVKNNAIASKRSGNIFIIPGTKNHLVADEFDDGVLQAIIKAARQDFDYIFLNCNAQLDNSGIVACLLEADHILVCSSGDTCEIRLFNERLRQLYRPQMPELVEKMQMVLIDRDPEFKEAEKQVQTTDLKYLGKVRYLPNLLSAKNNGGIIRGKEVDDYYMSLEQLLFKAGIITGQSNIAPTSTFQSIKDLLSGLIGKGA
ncbi:hypothetical protein BHU72_14740 [Desulfuribacillus stibiiarsenatis]|uniref:AAA domain-containing protein n=1 Tax=Desulfuribacillus stibiiarsenatis TaxID=1390249 RepID=A0A1E5L782_9FIRM|nr:hypothetical protein [Desulfuribacillus stibiiarsenatis]OEH86007.1 hypothetical protein BHU72_14740 [Desulfuribacillus stibiiarsenatis]